MTCEERIYSNDYIDIMTEYPPTPETVSRFTDDYCIQAVEDFGFYSSNRADIPNYNVSNYGYVGIPKLFITLQENSDFDTFNLNESGILKLRIHH